LDSEVEVFRRTETGWEPFNGGGGSGWFDPPFERSGIGPREVIGGHEHGSGGPEWSCCAVDDVAGTDPTWVEVIDAAGVERRPIESTFGAFIACSDGERTATVRVLDGDDAVLLSWTFGGHFDPSRIPGSFLSEFDEASGADSLARDEAGVIRVSTRDATSGEMHQLLLGVAQGPSGVRPEVRRELLSRLEGGDDPNAITQWLMTTRRESGPEGGLEP